MKAGIQADRRREKRYPQDIEVLVRELPGCDDAGSAVSPSIPGRIQNISGNGLCLVTFQPIRPLAIIRCELPVCNSEIRVPTLMQVRWTRKQTRSGDAYISGLEALL